uniref:Uncharacterized protein n=1 Tax=viral metagenome TaxID=1070528 RepID=A0A6H1ZWT7_9ZZZZ
MLADDTGYAYLASTDEELPEGVVHTKYGFRFLPRPHRLVGNPLSVEEEQAEGIMLRKYVWRDMGKPLWFGYAGKVGAMNPATLAVLQQLRSKKSISEAGKCIEDMEAYVKKLPRVLATKKLLGKGKALNLRGDLLGMLKTLKTEMKILPYTIIDPTRIKEIIPNMWTPSQLDALATNREMKGMKKAGKQHAGLILGGALIIGLVLLGIVLLIILRPMLFPAPTP